MLNNAEKIKLYLQEVEAARKLRAALDTCPEEDRPALRAKFHDAEVNCWEMFQSLSRNEKPSMDSGLQTYIKDVLEKLGALPEVAEDTPESEFRESVKLLCLALKDSPRDESNDRFIAPNPFTGG